MSSWLTDATVIDVLNDELISIANELRSIPPLPSYPRARQDDEESQCWGAMVTAEEGGGGGWEYHA